MMSINLTTRSLFIFLFFTLFILLPRAAPAQTTVTFAAVGDYGDDDAQELAVANLIDSLGPDFIVTTGDNSYDSTPIDENIGKYYSNYIGDYAGIYGPGSPINRFFPSPGNHDWNDGGGLPAYLAYFTLPGAGIPGSNTSGNERYYDFTRGPLHFFAIDSDGHEPDGRDSTSIQAQWLKAQLAASNSRWKIVYMHHPPYSSGASHGSESEMQWPYENWGATVVLAGHDHIYERITRDDNNDGIEFLYFVSGLGGRNIKDFTTPVPGSVVRYNGNFGSMLITASETELIFEFYSIDNGGTLIDSYTISGAGLLGDVSGDGAVNSGDALIILSYDSGLPIPPNFLDRINSGFGDVNSDGQTNSSDALVILSYDAGIPVPFPVGDPFIP